MPAPDAISCDQLARLLGTPKSPIVLDVRREAVRATDLRFLPGATALPEAALSAQSLTTLAARMDGPVVVVCAEGHRLSQGTAAMLRHMGVQAEYLLGGQAAWVAANLPLIDPAKITARDTQGRSVWVTRSRPKIDRIACPWLIRRFIDPQAVFLFVAPAEVQGVAERFGAMPFDIENVFWSHRNGLCTFDVLLSEFGLSTPALDKLALIVRGADTARLDLAPECAGLLAASLGLSRMYSDDLAQLEAGIALYDAFYRWARDATDETHNWPTNTGKPINTGKSK
ncbi:MAG: sulfurtransferase/chromate resistance protein [Pseudotabrizicola sp.]|uniref:sulfurtransferase/chromate resistance protein n=1 Tax=Pseudotabrizicola sp. TaxID=2939647 RepID=UPI002731C4D7|nr:sulfurtransferase/chromate resistance protein [Pseudotabrizicola sp.]MDP2080342.1 sulfurtransferase/chromate resistance protein [Pseudotabrizicola sp.]MDZ7573815.1 sulfurtransferase/chromate resistance protein [Pseudotabrizicola sp.]